VDADAEFHSGGQSTLLSDMQTNAGHRQKFCWNGQRGTTVRPVGAGQWFQSTLKTISTEFFG